ncbi:EamA family transporter [Rathayibacter soli]|uniref:EamA family transporter n=1 Tax=Rathayibacter soli TaxID=3144168 RepID=UPI0027E4E292|nr:EamA family transporter [Glaciibacter superstes]
MAHRPDRRRSLIGAGTQLGTEVSINLGSAIAGLLIPIVGAVVIVTVRQLVTVAAITPFYRPRPRQLTWRRLWPAIALGVVLAVMNLAFYESVGRLGLGLAATIEFLGPFTLALLGSRRLIDLACAVTAAAGILLLTDAAGPLDPFGVALALTAAAAWAAYILLTRRVANDLPGLEGLTVASIVASVILVPAALFVIDYAAIDWRVLGLLLAAGILSSALPYSLDTFILRRISARLYAIITSVGPVIAAAFGWLLLAETFTLQQQFGIVVVCAAAAVAVATQREHSRSELEKTAEA